MKASLICWTVILNWWLSPNAFAKLSMFDVFFWPMITHRWPHPIPIHLNPFHLFLYDMTSQSHPRWKSLEGARACRPWRELERAERELSQAMAQWKLLSSPLYSSSLLSSLPSSLFSPLIGYTFMLISASWSEVLGGDVITCGGKTRLARSFCSDDLLRLPFLPNF